MTRKPLTQKQKDKHNLYQRTRYKLHPRKQILTLEQQQKKIEYHRQYYIDNKPRLLLEAKVWHKANPEKAQQASIKYYRKKSGIDLNNIPLQKENCEICDKITKTHLDHCHITRKFRGWLCGNCNRALGMVYDNPKTLRKLAEYLERT